MLEVMGNEEEAKEGWGVAETKGEACSRRRREMKKDENKEVY